MLKPISDVEGTAVRVVIVTLDNHLSGAVERAQATLRKEIPGLTIALHPASEWAADPDALARCHEDIARGDIVIATMMFMEDHIQAVLPALEARQPDCDAMVALMSSGEVVRLTRMGKFAMNKPEGGVMALLKRLRGGSNKSKTQSSGAKQMAMLRRLPRILKFIPGTAQDVRAYFLSMQYWLAGSDENVANMVRFLVGRYADGPRAGLQTALGKTSEPLNYPDVGIYHPRLKTRVADSVERLPKPKGKTAGRVGVLVMRSYVLGKDTGHYDGVIGALEAKGLEVVPAFSSGLDARPAVEKFFMKDGKATVDALVSLTGFSLVGGPAYNDAKAAEDLLAGLDVPYIAAQPLEFQSLEQWGHSDRGLMPVESTIMVAIPELDGARAPMVFGGRASDAGAATGYLTCCERHCRVEKAAEGSCQTVREMRCCAERAELLADRVHKMVTLRATPPKDRKLAIVLFNFPPNAGAVGTAMNMAVYESLHNTLKALASHGYDVDVPADVDALRTAILDGNAARYGMDANVHAQIPADDHVRREKHLNEIETQWGPAPGRALSDGRSIFVLGAQFGSVFVGVQPAFGYEGDPMRLLFEKSFTPTHAFSAFYRYLREDFGAHAVLHFGTHGALEFMPGKQTGMSNTCWPDRLIGDLPNFYLYAANNPSEGTVAKRRSAATLISYLSPPVGHAGLYRGLLDLKASMERWRSLPPESEEEARDLAALIQHQAAELDLAETEPAWDGGAEREILALTDALIDLEQTLIPHGLHVVGRPPVREARVDMLLSVAEASHSVSPDRAVIESIVDGAEPEAALKASGLPNTDDTLAMFKDLARVNGLLAQDHETVGIVTALDGRFVRPAPGGDLLRTPDILPTGRNLHGFDPFRIPSAFAMADGARQAQRLLDRHVGDGNALPETVAIVLWGTDNLKSEGGPLAQALALIGAKPRFDSYGRLSGADLVPLEDLGRPRVDVMMTLSGIFRDLLPLQTRLLAEATFLAAGADEDPARNFVRKHALAYQRAHGCDLETASLRVFSNAEGVYGANVNLLIDSGAWEDENELADAYTHRKSFAYGRSGDPVQRTELLESVLGDVDLAYQNLESVELGVTTIDHYFDTLGGIGRAVQRAQGKAAPVYIGDQTKGEGKVRTLNEQVALETRTRTLNPRWYEAMLNHGYEGVRQIEAQVTNTLGWSATTGQVAPWVYQRLTQTFVLDDAMRKRLAELNPKASAKLANRLIEASERQYWTPDEATLEALREAGDELEDRLEGVSTVAAA